jgi:predicted enzyme related to lactoylglutathione lyase
MEEASQLPPAMATASPRRGLATTRSWPRRVNAAVFLASDESAWTLRSKGATVIWEPRPAPVPGARMAWLRDPEGNLIELLHRG